MNEALKKALHKIVMKAYSKGRESVSKEHSVNHILHDMADPNKKAQVPKSHVPATSESVLHKEMKPGQAVSEMHNQKQMNAQASLGMRPGAAKPPKNGSGAAPLAAPAGAGAPAGASSGGGGKPKGAKPLKNFMMRMSEKRGGSEKLAKGKGLQNKPNAAGKHGTAQPGVKGVHQPHVNSVANSPGGSIAGFHAQMGGKGDKQFAANARQLHGEKLNEQRAMPKPNLPKSEHADKVPMSKAHDKGVHIENTPHGKGVSTAGHHARVANHQKKQFKVIQGPSRITAIREHKKVLEDQKAMPKPNLPKSEHADKVPMKKARVDEGKSADRKIADRRQRNWRTTTRTHQEGYRTVGPDRPGMPRYASDKVVGEPDLRPSKKLAGPKGNLPKSEKAPASPMKKDLAGSMKNAFGGGSGQASPSTPPPAPAPSTGGKTINSQIGFPFGKSAGKETKHDRCAADVKAKNPDIRNPHAVCVAAGVKPSKWKK